ncbi:hypothetical protein NERG_02550 [Nematocida ausubeli]|uniref:Uncharacterized protein n=1 Tax=Nematocida ausubeli (strain ATCC PRA-371 / ERTm2) TaxID=1913371 RepID=H8ZG29_NEMA1|nr:hypothetical protein NERG_02550 [Nematocida ausubeli]
MTNGKLEAEEYAEACENTTEDETIYDSIDSKTPPKKRRQEDQSFFQDAIETAKINYKKLKNNERIPTFYLDVPCPQCGGRTIGHGQKHRIERKCNRCLLTFQMDTWLIHLLNFNTPLKHIIDRSLKNVLGIYSRDGPCGNEEETKNSMEKEKEQAEEYKRLKEGAETILQELKDAKESISEMQASSKQYKNQIAQIRGCVNKLMNPPSTSKKSKEATNNNSASKEATHNKSASKRSASASNAALSVKKSDTPSQE